METLVQLETPRLLLRPWKNSDIAEMILLNQDPKVMEYFPATMSVSETQQMMQRIIAHFDEWGYGLWAAEYKENQECIGFIGLSHPRFENDFTPCVEIGWRLKLKYWGKGLATEGAKEVLKYGMAKLLLPQIYSWTATPNKSSIRVMQKIGMRFQGTFLHPNLPAEDPLCEHVIYRTPRKEYQILR